MGAPKLMSPSACGSNDKPFVVLADEKTNLDLTSRLTLRPTIVQGGTTALTFDWSHVTSDFYGHPIDWTKIGRVVLVVWNASVEQISNAIAADESLSPLVLLPAQFDPYKNGTVQTSASLTDFLDPGGGRIDDETFTELLTPDRQYTYTLLLQEDPLVFGVGTRMIHAFTLDAASTSTNISMDNESTTLRTNATLGRDVLVPLESASITIDWSSTIETRSFGGPFSPTGVTQVIVARYDADFDVTDRIFDIELDAKDLYRADVPFGSSILLDSLQTMDGRSFQGIDAVDQWFVGLLCRSKDCRNPAPWYMARLTACP